MFESLSDKLQETFRDLARRGKLSEGDVKSAMRDVRMALLEADVNYKVVREFVARVSERAVGVEVSKSLTPAQAVVKIVNEELVSLLGEASPLDLGGQPPKVIMLVGLQGSGKTTMAAKLATHLRKAGEHPLMVAADVYRPAAIQQLQTLGRQVDVTVHAEGDDVSPPDICAHAVARARREGFTLAILDTAGRLQVDDRMMAELEDIKKRTKPAEVLLIADAMTGQEAVNVAQAFYDRVGITGLILSKVDADARGGAALSIRSVTGVPIKFMGVGEKVSDLEVFYPDRLASRILGMGDVLTLIERAEASITEEDAQRMEQKLRKAQFTFQDFLDQLDTVRSMGPISEILGMVPGMGQLAKQIPAEVTDKGLKTTEAIIQSMTRQERDNPKIINASRKRRIARGSGTSVQQVNQLLRQFSDMQRMMKQLGGGGKRGRRRMQMPFLG